MIEKSINITSLIFIASIIYQYIYLWNPYVNFGVWRSRNLRRKMRTNDKNIRRFHYLKKRISQWLLLRTKKRYQWIPLLLYISSIFFQSSQLPFLPVYRLCILSRVIHAKSRGWMLLIFPCFEHDDPISEIWCFSFSFDITSQLLLLEQLTGTSPFRILKES